MTTSIESHQKSNRTWIGILAAIVLSLLIVISMWWEFRTPSAGTEIDVGDVGHSGRSWMPIHSDGKGVWSVWSAPAALYINGSNQFSINLRSRGLIPDDTRNLAVMAFRVSREHRAAQAIGATKDQLARVHGIQLPRVVVSQSDIDSLKKLWADYQAASADNKLSAQNELLNALHTVGENCIEPTRKVWSDAAALTKKTFSAQQISEYQKFERSEQQHSNHPAAPKPTTQNAG